MRFLRQLRKQGKVNEKFVYTREQDLSHNLDTVGTFEGDIFGDIEESDLLSGIDLVFTRYAKEPIHWDNRSLEEARSILMTIFALSDRPGVFHGNYITGKHNVGYNPERGNERHDVHLERGWEEMHPWTDERCTRFEETLNISYTVQRELGLGETEF